MGGVPRTHKGDYNDDGSRAVKPVPPVVVLIPDATETIQADIDIPVAAEEEEKVKPKLRRRRRK